MTTVVLATNRWTSWPDYAGSTWVPMQYLLGFRKLGVEVYWVDHLRRVDPYEHVHSLDYLVARFDATARDFGFGDRYAVVYDGGKRYFGLSREHIAELGQKADLLLALSGKGLPPESPLLAASRRAYVDMDPGFTQIWVHQGRLPLDQFDHFFTVGQNVGGPDFAIPTDVEWQPILPPMDLDEWPARIDERSRRFSTVGDWWGKQYARFNGELYGAKREEFLRFLEVPSKVEQEIEVALAIYQADHRELGRLHQLGWRLVNPCMHAGDPHSYREFIQRSRAEFSVAKGGYVRSNSGWVSDRTACYLASGKPALVQSTGFEDVFPTDRGLLTFSTIEEAIEGIEAIDRDYTTHARAARQLAEERFSAAVVLPGILRSVGL